MASPTAEERLLLEALRMLPPDAIALLKAKQPAERLELLRALVQVCSTRCFCCVVLRMLAATLLTAAAATPTPAHHHN